MAKGKRRTEDELVAYYKKKIEEVEQRKRDRLNKKKEITRETEGVKEALKALEHVVETNKVSMGELIKFLSKTKRTGLRIQDPLRKGETDQATQPAENPVSVGDPIPA